MSIKNSYTLTISLFTITILSGIFLSSNIASATGTNTAQDNVAVNVPVSCTMNGTGMTSHNANIPNGTYESEIGTTTLKSFCNDSQGFAIYAIGYTNEEYGNTTLIGANQGQTIVTGTATTTGNPDVSNWAVKLATDSTATYPITLDNSFGSYSSVPSTYTKVAHRDSGTDLGSSATGASLTTTYAAYISKTQRADTYNGKVKYTLVHPASEEPLQPQPATAGCINYFANGSNVVGEMGCQSASNNASVDLWASNFSRSGYGFAGWNDKFDYSGNYYGPNQTITAPSDVQTNGLSLYAVWIKSAGSIQNWNGCSSLASGATTALTDERDNNTYAVAKLADGKCWMIENLRLDDTASHNTDGTLAQGYNSSFIGLANSESSGFTNSSTANSLYSTDGSTTVTISGNSTAYRFPRYNNFNTHSRQSSSSYSTDGNTYSMGNYYTWHAAVADTNYYASNNRSIETTSLCPTGWRLPRGGNKSNEGNNDFWALIVTGLNNGIKPANYNSNTSPSYANTAEASPVSNSLRSYPNNFLLSGLFNSGVAASRFNYGDYWSSTLMSNENSYYLSLTREDSVIPGTYGNNAPRGFSIRCLISS